MEFRLTFPVEPLPQKISYRHKILMAGSCFAENIGALMAQNRFDVFTNPNGIVYNPVSLAHSLQRALEGKLYTENELFYYNELWNSWQHHGGAYSNQDKATCLNDVNTDLNKANKYLRSGNWLVVTFGSAFVYRLKSTNQIVANCHKYPAKEFDKELLTVEEITTIWGKLVSNLAAINPGLNIILTVSPVRYVRDGLVQNNLGKAILLQAVHGLCNAFSNIHYFPAYELVMDDLRDYRFFTADMVHPTGQAIEYVWEKFASAAFDDEARLIYAQVRQFVAAMQHRPFNPGTEAYRKFLAANLDKLQKLLGQYPFLDAGPLLAAFKRA